MSGCAVGCGGSCCFNGVCCGSEEDGVCIESTQFCCGHNLACSNSQACGIYEDLSNSTRSLCTSATGLAGKTTTIVSSTSSSTAARSSAPSSAPITTTLTSSTAALQPSTASISASKPSIAATSSAGSSLSSGSIEGIVIGVLAALLLAAAGAFFFFRWHRRHPRPGREPFRPLGGRYELPVMTESDQIKDTQEADGAHINEMEVPPLEAGGGLVHEMPAESRPTELSGGHAGRNY